MPHCTQPIACSRSSLTRARAQQTRAGGIQMLPGGVRGEPHCTQPRRSDANVRARQTRAVAGECFLEACVENAAKAPLVLDYVRFDPTPGLLAAPVLRGGGAPGAPGAGLAEYVQALQARPPGAGSCLHACARRPPDL